MIPMAGLSSRFANAGYSKPKYMLELAGKSLFQHSVGSFLPYCFENHFVFICRDVEGTPEFVRSEAKKLGLKSWELKVLDIETEGQADSVAMGLGMVNSESNLTIFNIDTFRKNLDFRHFEQAEKGVIEVFEGPGNAWSFVKPGPNNQVLMTAEKQRISNLCSTGLYHFPRVDQFLEIVQRAKEPDSDLKAKGEIYVAPLYNALIAMGVEVVYYKVQRNEVAFCGVPDEYVSLQKAVENGLDIFV